jgi:fructan beta-fructosidase
MTLPRELSLAKVGNQYVLKSTVVGQIASLVENQIEEATVRLPKTVESEIVSQAEISFSAANSSLKLVFSNSENDSLILHYDDKANTFSIDRTNSGVVDFEENFGKEIHQIQVPNIEHSPLNFKIYTDQSSIEIFINDGIYAFTEIVFPGKSFNKLKIFGDENKEIKNFTVKKMRAIW